MTEGKDRETVPGRGNAAGPGSDMWMDAAQDPRFAAGTKLEGERATLLDYLRACRLTMEMKCAGLDPAQLARRSVPPSAMSLLGLIRHMADVERNWFRWVMAQADAPPLASGQARLRTKLASRAARRPQLADLGDRAHALVAGMVQGAPAR